MNPGLPVVLSLIDVPCLVVGGGVLATRRIASLLEAGADITVVSPVFTEQITKWIEEKQIKGNKKRYERSDGEGAALIFAATNDDAVNEQVVIDARRRLQWVNAPGELRSGHFSIPAILQRGKMQIAVSTSGASPAFSASVRDELGLQYGEELEPFIDFLYEARAWIKLHIEDMNMKRRMLHELGTTDWLRWARSGKSRPTVQQWVHSFMQKNENLSDVKERD